MEATDQAGGPSRCSIGIGRTLRMLAVHGLVTGIALQLVPVAAAHEGSVHAGAPPLDSAGRDCSRWRNP